MDNFKGIVVVLSALVLVFLLVLGLFGIVHWLETPEGGTEAPSGGPTSYNDTVYYFEGNKDFGPRLAAWIKEHPEFRVVSVASLDTEAYGSTRGYWVVVEEKKK